MPSAKTPLPGEPVRGSTSGQPLMAAFDLLGRRWAITVLWAVGFGPVGFRRLRETLTTISPTVLSTRLKELVEAQLAMVDEQGKYHLSPVGVALIEALTPLKQWSYTWAQELEASKNSSPANPTDTEQ